MIVVFKLAQRGISQIEFPMIYFCLLFRPLKVDE